MLRAEVQACYHKMQVLSLAALKAIDFLKGKSCGLKLSLRTAAFLMRMANLKRKETLHSV